MTEQLTNKVVQEHLSKLLNDFQTIQDFDTVYNYIDGYRKQNFPVYKSLQELNRKMDILETFSIN